MLIGVIGVIGVYQGSSAASAPRFKQADFRPVAPESEKVPNVQRICPEREEEGMALGAAVVIVAESCHKGGWGIQSKAVRSKYGD